MKRLLVISLILIVSYRSRADVGQAEIHALNHHHRKVKVAVIDTGIDPKLMSSDSLCDSGHRDFTGAGLKDNHGHGTHISGIIDQYAKNVFLDSSDYFDYAEKAEISGKKLEDTKLHEYCQIIIKYYDPTVPGGHDNLKNTIKSLRWAIDNKVDIINYSGGGLEPSREEKDLITEALDKGIKVVAAAGNESNDLSKIPYYPASYDKRIYVVGNLVKNKVTPPADKNDKNLGVKSNYGKPVNTWEVGTSVFSRTPANGRGISYGYMSGTSQATAVKSGKLVREMLFSK